MRIRHVWYNAGHEARNNTRNRLPPSHRWNNATNRPSPPKWLLPPIHLPHQRTQRRHPLRSSRPNSPPHRPHIPQHPTRRAIRHRPQLPLDNPPTSPPNRPSHAPNEPIRHPRPTLIPIQHLHRMFPQRHQRAEHHHKRKPLLPPTQKPPPNKTLPLTSI